MAQIRAKSSLVRILLQGFPRIHSHMSSTGSRLRGAGWRILWDQEIMAPPLWAAYFNLEY